MRSIPGVRSAVHSAASSDLVRYPVIARPERQQYTRFALLRTQPEGIPARVQHVLNTPILGMNWTLAQRIPVNLPGDYWLVPGNGHLCIVDRGSLGSPAVGTTCARTQDAIAHSVASITITAPDPAARVPAARLVVGVTPDGAREVQVHSARSVTTSLVVGTTFVLRDSVALPPDFLSWR